ncbi:MAG: hypothetical protein ACI80V_002699 [Rhodothermales bacterium]|jgi:hypothetical protein
MVLPADKTLQQSINTSIDPSAGRVSGCASFCDPTQASSVVLAISDHLGCDSGQNPEPVSRRHPPEEERILELVQRAPTSERTLSARGDNLGDSPVDLGSIHTQG